MPLSAASSFFKKIGGVDVAVGLRLRDTKDPHQVLNLVAEFVDEHEGNILPVVGFQRRKVGFQLPL